MPLSDPEIVVLPASLPDQTFVIVSALDGGHLTLLEKLFVTDADPDKRVTVPSLSFLIQHPSPPKTTKIVFDLGLQRDLSGYRDAQQHHIAQRTPSDFSKAGFIVGSGTLHLLANGDGPLYPVELFNADELPQDRTRELPPTHQGRALRSSSQHTSHTWRALAGFPSAIDYFGDGSLYIIDAPGHLIGHVNLLARTGHKKWVYLGGDCCHDPRILSGEKGIATYDDGRGGLRSVHADTNAAANTVKIIARLLKQGKIREEDCGGVEIQVVVAHDGTWREENREKFWPRKL